MFILRSSKTYAPSNSPQIIKISSIDSTKKKDKLKMPCPYQLLQQFASLRGPYDDQKMEPFFVFAGGIPMKPTQMRYCLKVILREAGFDETLYGVQGFCMGRSEDLLKLGLSVETIKKLDRWKSNAVFKYLRFTSLSWNVHICHNHLFSCYRQNNT